MLIRIASLLSLSLLLAACVQAPVQKSEGLSKEQVQQIRKEIADALAAKPAPAPVVAPPPVVVAPPVAKPPVVAAPPPPVVAAPVTPAAPVVAPVLTPDMTSSQALALWSVSPWKVAECHRLTRTFKGKPETLVVVGLREDWCPKNPKLSKKNPCESGVVLAEHRKGDPTKGLTDWHPACLKKG